MGGQKSKWEDKGLKERNDMIGQKRIGKREGWREAKR